MDFRVRFNEEKNQLLRATRNISFEGIVDALEGDDLLVDIAHPSQKRASQRMYVVRIESYAYAVPYVIDLRRNEVFLKTIYPSRIFTQLYLRKGA
jgi:hypothetical protein